MKIFTVLLSLMLFSLTTSFAQVPSTQLAQHNRVHDFGQILEKNGVVSHTFTFTNTGKQPVIINGTHSGCGCTSTDFTKLPIKPGAKGHVTVTYNPAHRPGVFSKELVIFFNDKKNYTRIWVKGTVIPALRPVEEDHPYNFGRGLHTSRKVLPFGTISKGTSREITLFYANNTVKEMLLTFKVDENHPDLTFTNPGKLSANERGKMVFKYTASSNNRKSMVFNVYPYVDGKKLSVPIVVKVTEAND